MKEFIDKLIERLEELQQCQIEKYTKSLDEGNLACIYDKTDIEDAKVGAVWKVLDIVTQLAEEYKEECNLDCDKLLFAYSDLLRRFQNAEETVICEFSGNISKETEELEAECEELLSQFKEILYSANTPQKSAEEYKVSEMPAGWIPCSEKQPPKPRFKEDTYLIQQSDVIAPYSAYWNGECWTDVLNDKLDNVIAWMPLPAPYTEGE